MPDSIKDYNLTKAQRTAIISLWDRYGTKAEDRIEGRFCHTFDLPRNWVAGWVSDRNSSQAIYVGISPEGEVHS